MNVLKGASRFGHRTAVIVDGSTCSYKELLQASQQLAAAINGESTVQHESAARVAIMAGPGRHYVQGTWAAWLAGAIAIPLCLSHPAGQLQYVLEDARVSTVLTTRDLQPRMAPITAAAGSSLHVMDDHVAGSTLPHAAERLPAVRDEDGALIVYTSGTTGNPKGALHTHANLAAHVEALVTAWEWQVGDRILHALPLHHVHGIINALYCAHAVGAAVEFLPKFSPAAVWERLMRKDDPVSVFMGVPTMYSYLLSHYDAMPAERQAAARAAASRLRLAVSGSAACPLPIMRRWQQLSGQWLLERYGMTETNMILSNPYRGEQRPGSVGLPLPGVQVRVVGDGDDDAAGGELRVKGPNVFAGYWGKPGATAEAFDEDGWFRTGDTAVMDGTPPYWRILGRTSVDIIKSGGYKISAPGIENVLLSHPRIAECAVLGLPDETMGQVVAAVIACEGEGEVGLEELQAWTADRLPAYQIPMVLSVLDSIPRNAMGKVNKKQLMKDVFQQ